MGALQGTERIRALLAMDKRGLPEDGGSGFNRLIFEKSPYLLQHAENPVNWYPWGDEAFAAAAAADKPLFVSIGYATCHWCHVMEGESFEDAEVAEVMNREFVPVKIDREERPDLDEQYMTVSQLMTGSGGWPLNVVMTPDRRPFFIFTYLPKRGRPGLPSIIQVMENVGRLWREQRQVVESNCGAVMKALQQTLRSSGGAVPEEEQREDAYRQMRESYDEEHGGFGAAPKFPMPHYISFLLRHAVRGGASAPAEMALHTLDALRRGGICDQLGFGIHRYATDREWLIPHFEKMLYDQALISSACWAAYRFGGDGRWLRMGEEILSFVLREMKGPSGGFCSGLDADSEGEEGRFYLWGAPELRRLLGEEDGALFCRLFGVTEEGNFEGRNILHLPVPPDEFARREGLSPEDLRERMERWRSVLLPEREKRVRPLRDEKVLAGWNGLMIASLATAYAVTGDTRYYREGVEAAQFVLERLRSPQGRLMRSFHGGVSPVPGFLEDYAFLSHGLVELHQATLEEEFLREALTLAREMLRLFGGGEGGLYEVGSDAEQPLVRIRSAHDGVIPSGNSVAARVLLRLGAIAEDPELAAAGERIVLAFAGDLRRNPAAHLGMLAAMDLLPAERGELRLVGKRTTPQTAEMLRLLHRRFLPSLVIRFSEEGDAEGVRAFPCIAGACRPPVGSAGELEELLDSL